jgi:hypothetical protein
MYILYSIPSTASCLCRSAIAHPYIYMYLFIPLHLCVKVVVVKLLDYFLDITARSELEAQALTSANHVYVTNKITFDLI